MTERATSVHLPSIASQPSRELSWLLVIDRNLPPVSRSRFDQARPAIGTGKEGNDL